MCVIVISQSPPCDNHLSFDELTFFVKISVSEPTKRPARGNNFWHPEILVGCLRLMLPYTAQRLSYSATFLLIKNTDPSLWTGLNYVDKTPHMTPLWVKYPRECI